MNRFYDALPTAFFDDAPVCIIVGAGDLGDYVIAPGGDDLVIAADGGYRYLQAAGVRCDLLMGDLDSLPPDTVIGTETRRYNPIKDDTDTMLAVRHGLSLGYRKFLLFGMFGAKYYAKITKVPSSVLIPIIAALFMLGAFSYRNLPFDMIIVLFFGIVGFYMDRTGIPMAPFVLAFVLGKTAEIDLRRTIIIMSGNGLGALFHPLPLALLTIDIVMLIAPFWDEIKGLLGIGKKK